MEAGGLTPTPRPSEGGRDELNLAEFPITVLTERVPKGLRTLVFSDQIQDQATGELVTRKVTISGSDAYGLPGPLDMDVLLCLIQMTKVSNNFTNPEVKFSRGELLKLLRLPDSGKHYRRIDESLRRWLGVTLYHESSWWDKAAQEWSTTEGWHILEHLAIVDRVAARRRRARGQLDLFPSSFTWNAIFFRSCQADNIKRLDLDTYFALERAISRRMFRFLDKRFYRGPDWTFQLREFAFEHIGISRNYDTGEIKAKLQPALDELEAIGFLEPMGRERRYAKVGRGGWTITLARKANRIGTNPPPAPAPEREPTGLVRELASRGVTPATAEELVAAHAEEHIRARLEVFDWLVQKKDKRVSKSPGGYLADSIRKGYVPPKGFEPKAEREERLQAEAQQKRRAHEAQQRAQAAERAREEAERARINAYWEALSAAEQEALKAEAIGAADSFFVGRYQQKLRVDPQAAEFWLKMILESHITKLLDGPGHRVQPGP